MKVYISGMITSLKHDEYRKEFDKAAQYLRSEGHEPVDPSQLGKPEHRSWHYYMKKAIPQLLECDAIYMLRNWSSSKGARLERHIALELDMPCFTQAEEENKSLDMDTGGYGKQGILHG